MIRWLLATIAFLLASQVLPVNAQAASVPVIGTGTPCTASWSEGTYTGTLSEYEIFIDIAAPTPGKTVPTATISGTPLPKAPPYAVTWSICDNLPNLSPGTHTIAVSAKSAGGFSGLSAVIPFVFERVAPPVPTFSDPPVQ